MQAGDSNISNSLRVRLKGADCISTGADLDQSIIDFERRIRSLSLRGNISHDLDAQVEDVQTSFETQGLVA